MLAGVYVCKDLIPFKNANLCKGKYTSIKREHLCCSHQWVSSPWPLHLVNVASWCALKQFDHQKRKLEFYPQFCCILVIQDNNSCIGETITFFLMFRMPLPFYFPAVINYTSVTTHLIYNVYNYYFCFLGIYAISYWYNILEICANTNSNISFECISNELAK